MFQEMAPAAINGQNANPVDMRLKHPIDFCPTLGFKDPNDIEAYNIYRLDQCSLSVVTFIILVYSADSIYSACNAPDIYWATILLLAAVLVLCHLLQIIVHKREISSLKFERFLPWTSPLCNAVAVVASTGAAYAYFCHQREPTSITDGGRPQEIEMLRAYIIKAMVVPFYLRTIDRWALIMNGLTILFLALWSLSTNGGVASLHTFMLSIVAVVVMFEFDHNRMCGFSTMLDLKHAAQIVTEHEVQRNVAEQMSIELRSFIGNIAHDLKTPVQAMVTELDLLSVGTMARTPRFSSFANNSSTVKKHCSDSEIISPRSSGTHAVVELSPRSHSPRSSGKNTPPELRLMPDGVVRPSNLAPLIVNLHPQDESESNVMSIRSLKSLCTFMTTPINRSLDFVKSESGVPLVPSVETFELQSRVAFVIYCVSNISNFGVPIRLTSISKDITPFIITDKVWFEENLLCLTSNAAKFTNRGSVDVRICLVRAEASSVIDLTSITSLNGNANQPHQPSRHTKLKTLSEVDVEAQDIDIDIDIEAHGCHRPRHQSHDSVTSTNSTVKMTPRTATSQTATPRIVTPRAETHLVDHRPGPKQDMLLVEVEDSGIGLTAEQMEGLFRPFQQAQRKAGGTGLGLYALLKRCDAIGGRCGVRKREDGQSGCVFWFEVPYHAYEVNGTESVLDETHHSLRNARDLLLDESNHSVTRTPRQGVPAQLKTTTSSSRDEADTDAAPAPASIRILLVEDTPMIQKTTYRALRREGYKVDISNNGAEALEQLEKMEASGGYYDIMLLDIQMPVMDGLECIQRLRAREAAATAVTGADNSNTSTKAMKGGSSSSSSSSSSCENPGTPRRQFVVGVSAASDADTRESALSLGMDYFIMKPMKVSQLKEHCSFLRGTNAQN